jgi:hypothetical protein
MTTGRTTGKLTASSTKVNVAIFLRGRLLWERFLFSSAEKSFYKVRDRGLAITAVYEKDGNPWALGYHLPSRQRSKYRDWEILNVPIDELTL